MSRARPSQWPAFRSASGTSWIILVLGVLGIIGILTQGITESVLFLYLGLDGKVFLKGHVWRLITYFLLHGGMLHLALNCLIIGVVGRSVEMRLGARFVLVSFLAGAIGGGFAGAIPQALIQGAPAIGASAGGLALVPAAVALYWNHRREAVRWTVRLLFIFYLVGEFASIFANRGGLLPVVPVIHLGGLITGWAVYAKRDRVLTLVDSTVERLRVSGE